MINRGSSDVDPIKLQSLSGVHGITPARLDVLDEGVIKDFAETNAAPDIPFKGAARSTWRRPPRA